MGPTCYIRLDSSRFVDLCCWVGSGCKELDCCTNSSWVEGYGVEQYVLDSRVFLVVIIYVVLINVLQSDSYKFITPIISHQIGVRQING